MLGSVAVVFLVNMAAELIRIRIGPDSCISITLPPEAINAMNIGTYARWVHRGNRPGGGGGGRELFVVGRVIFL